MPFLAPVIGAVVSAVGAAASFIGGLGFVGKAIIGIGLQLAANAIAKKKQKAPASEPRGTQLDVQYGGSEPRQIGVGLFATAGQDVYTNTFDVANKTISKVFVLSDFPIAQVTRVAVNGEWHGLQPSTNDRGSVVDGVYAGRLWVKVYRGLPGQTADPFLIATSNPAGRWTHDHRGDGIAYAIVYADYDDEHMSSFPTMLFECQGLAYDPRRDSTVGGSGPQRFGDVATWAASENPIVHAYTYERGFFLGGELIVGKGMPAADLPLGPWMAAMNVCDEAVAGGEARYRAGVIFTAADGTTHRDNLEPVLNAAGAALVERVDGDLPVVGANQPVVATLTDDDLIVGETVTFQAKRSRSNLINAVHGAFNRPADLWASTAYPAQRDPTALAVDRERHAVQIDFAAVYSERQATTLALQALRENRYQAGATAVVRPRWIVLEIGDWVRWNLRGQGERIWRVVGRSLAPLGESGARNVTLSLQEVGPGIYDQSVVIPEGPPRVPLAGPVFQSTVNGFLAFATTAVAESGRTYPAIVAQWDAIEDVTVDAVIVEYWKESDPANRIRKVVQFAGGQRPTRTLIVEGLLPRSRYVLQATVQTNPPRATLWSGSQTIVTLDEDLAFALAQLNKDITDIIQRGSEAQVRFDATLEEIANAVAVMASQGEIGNRDAQARIIREEKVRIEGDRVLAEKTDGVIAELRDPTTGLPAQAAALQTLRGEVTTIDGRVAANSTAITATQSSLAGTQGTVAGQAQTISSLSSEVARVDGRVTATSEAVTGVSTRVGTLDASGLISFRAQAIAGDGSYSRLAILARASSVDQFKETGLYIDTTPTSSTILVRTDRFIVTDGTTTGFPFVIEQGVVKLAVARFQRFVSMNDRLIIDGLSGVIEVYD